MRAIVAVDNSFAIGYNGDLPWPRIEEDMAQFYNATVYSAVIMGRRTWESMKRKPLDRRLNIVLSKTLPYIDNMEAVCVARNPSEALLLASGIKSGSGPWCIGGAEVYRAFLPYTKEVRVTWVYGQHPADTYLDPNLILQFPKIEAMDSFVWGRIEHRSRHDG